MHLSILEIIEKLHERKLYAWFIDGCMAEYESKRKHAIVNYTMGRVNIRKSLTFRDVDRSMHVRIEASIRLANLFCAFNAPGKIVRNYVPSTGRHCYSMMQPRYRNVPRIIHSVVQSRYSQSGKTSKDLHYIYNSDTPGGGGGGRGGGAIIISAQTTDTA